MRETRTSCIPVPAPYSRPIPRPYAASHYFFTPAHFSHTALFLSLCLSLCISILPRGSLRYATKVRKNKGKQRNPCLFSFFMWSWFKALLHCPWLFLGFVPFSFWKLRRTCFMCCPFYSWVLFSWELFKEEDVKFLFNFLFFIVLWLLGFCFGRH